MEKNVVWAYLVFSGNMKSYKNWETWSSYLNLKIKQMYSFWAQLVEANQRTLGHAMRTELQLLKCGKRRALTNITFVFSGRNKAERLRLRTTLLQVAVICCFHPSVGS